MNSPKGTLNGDDWNQILSTLASTLLCSLFYIVVMYLSSIKWDPSTPVGIYMFNTIPFLVILVKQLLTGLPPELTPILQEVTSTTIKNFNPPVEVLVPSQTPPVIVPVTSKPDIPHASPE